MLVQMTLDSVWEVEGEYAGEAFCSHCGESIGILSRAELRAALVQTAADLLCFNCEVLKPMPYAKPRRELLAAWATLFPGYSLEELPIHASACFARDDFSAVLQLWPGAGWMYWCVNPEGERVLRRRGLNYVDAKKLKDAHFMMPFELA